MTGFLLRRLAWLGFVLWLVSVIIFLLSRVVPGDPAAMILGPRATPDAVAALRQELQLDQPLIVQYLNYAGQVATGDFGESVYSGRPVIIEIFERMPATLELMLLAFFVSVAVGLLLGSVSALNHNGAADVLIRVGATLGISTPSFWVGLMLLVLFYGVLDWLPATGRFPAYLEPPQPATGFYLIDSIAEGSGQKFLTTIEYLILPVVTLSLVTVGHIARQIRASMIEVLNSEYMQTAKVMGIPFASRVLKYAMPNALIPFMTVAGIEFAHLIFGSVVVEAIFGWPGVGTYMMESILQLDTNVIFCFTILACVVFVVINTLVDIAQLILNPEIERNEGIQ